MAMGWEVLKKIAPAITYNRTCLFVQSHMRFLKIAPAIFQSCTFDSVNSL